MSIDWTQPELETNYDVVVLGSGAAGLVAALAARQSGASVVVLEKSEFLGGTTSAGGGVMWAPATNLGADAGYPDSPQAGVDYINAATDGLLVDGEAQWYVDAMAAAVEFLVTKTSVRLTPLARPDYHMEWPGAVAGGRSLDNDAFDLTDRPNLARTLRPSSYFPPLTMVERDNLNGKAPDAALLDSRRAAGVRTMGGALAGSLAASALDAGIGLRTSTPATSLTKTVDGWSLEAGGKTISAKAVVIASGGFEWSPVLQESFLPYPIVPISAPSNEGDGLKLAMQAGAALRDMTSVWGVPVIAPPTQQYDGKPSGRMGNVEMTLPGSITVNSAGRRFVNEALNYHDTNRVFASIDPITGKLANNPAWLVFDKKFLDSYPVAGSTPGQPTEWMSTAPSIDALASAIGVNPAGLSAQVAEFNEHAAKGEDPQFGRGASEQDRFLGDANNLPNPCLRPLTEAPFFAVRIHPGTLGTAGGILTNRDGQVVTPEGTAIEGLYAAGNAASSVFRNSYPGGGATLGSGISRAYSAGAHIAGVHRERQHG